jgi:NADPH:quinone reductase-like Zn-dependent oxidoreductase
MPTMNAIVIDHYGPPEVLQHKKVEIPFIHENEILVRVHASSVNPVDCNVRRGDLKTFMRLRLPTILGVDCAGEVVEVGAAVRDFQVGDAVFSFNHLKCGGGYAEYAALDPAWARPKPRNLSYLEAAALPGVSETALQGLRRQAHLTSGQSMLLIGASGGVGSVALQLAKALGAEVTAVCGTSNVAMVKGLGADQVIDYKTADVMALGQRFDLVFDCIGTRSFWDYRKLLKPRGTHVVVPSSPKHMLNSILAKLDLGHSSKWYFADPSSDDLEFIRTLAEAGKLRPVIDRTFRLDELAEAHRYSETGHAAGKISIQVIPDSISTPRSGAPLAEG